MIGEGELEKRTNLNRLMTEINGREAAKKALNITKTNNHNFKVEIDAEASKHLFPSNERLKIDLRSYFKNRIERMVGFNFLYSTETN